MKAAFILFDRMTFLDFIGFYDAVTRLKTMKIQAEFEWRTHAQSKLVTDDRNMRLEADVVGGSLAGYDMLFIPGGFTTRALQHDAITVVFLNVLLQQIGLPVPAVPTLLLAGSLATTPFALGKVLAAALVAAVAEPVVETMALQDKVVQVLLLLDMQYRR